MFLMTATITAPNVPFAPFIEAHIEARIAARVCAGTSVPVAAADLPNGSIT